MMDLNDLKRRIVHPLQRYLVNPIGRRTSAILIETTGRKSGQPRQTAVGGRLVGDQFWLVSEHGEHSDYVKNIKANPSVRVRLAGGWRTGTARLLPDDDPAARLREVPGLNSNMVRAMGSDLLTICVDLD